MLYANICFRNRDAQKESGSIGRILIFVLTVFTISVFWLHKVEWSESVFVFSLREFSFFVIILFKVSHLVKEK